MITLAPATPRASPISLYAQLRRHFFYWAEDTSCAFPFVVQAEAAARAKDCNLRILSSDLPTIRNEPSFAQPDAF